MLRRLRISTPGDAFEREADRLADRALQAPRAPNRIAVEHATGGAAIQRKCRGCEDDELVVQRVPAAGGTAARDGGPSPIAARIADARGGGAPLPAATRADMEGRFAHPFDRVRIHADGTAAQLSRALSADAFTVGSDIFFSAGAYAPATPAGRHLLAHELVHVMQQREHAGDPTPLVQRAVTRGAGGCAPAMDIDEDDEGLRGAGIQAHRQIQQYMLGSGVFAELPIPRSTKTQIGDVGCQPDGTRLGYEDLYRLIGSAVQLAEIKPFRTPPQYAREEVTHYIRRADQSMSRSYLPGGGTCAAGAGLDDRRFAQQIGATQTPSQFLRMTGILPVDTTIGPFWGDPSRTLRARLQEPGAVGYWCTGGGSDTVTCGLSEQQLNAMIDQAMGPGSAALDAFVSRVLVGELDHLADTVTSEQVIDAALRVFGPAILAHLGIDLGRLRSLLPGGTLRELYAFLDARIGAQLRGLFRSLIITFAAQIASQLRVRLRAMLREMLQEAIVAACVGAPIVTMAELLDRLNRMFHDRTRQLIPVLVTAAVAAFAIDVAQSMMATLSALFDAIAAAASWLADKIKRVLAVVAFLVVCVATVVLGFLAAAAIFDPIPGDEVALGMATAAVAALIPTLIRYIRTGSTAEQPPGTPEMA